MKKTKKELQKELRDMIVECNRNGEVVFSTLEGLASAKISDFIEQPADGILYDLNRLPEVVMTYISDPKWINDYAVALTIRALKDSIESLKYELDEACIRIGELNLQLNVLEEKLQQKQNSILTGKV